MAILSESPALENVSSFYRRNEGILLVALAQLFGSMMNLIVKLFSSLENPVPPLQVCFLNLRFLGHSTYYCIFPAHCDQNGVFVTLFIIFALAHLVSSSHYLASYPRMLHTLYVLCQSSLSRFGPAGSPTLATSSRCCWVRLLQLLHKYSSSHYPGLDSLVSSECTIRFNICHFPMLPSYHFYRHPSPLFLDIFC